MSPTVRPSAACREGVRAKWRPRNCRSSGSAGSTGATLRNCRAASSSVSRWRARRQLELPRRSARPGPATVAIRPDALLLGRDRPQDPALPGRIVKSAYLGTHMEYTVECTLGSLFVVDRATADPYPIGADVWVGFVKTG